MAKQENETDYNERVDLRALAEALESLRINGRVPGVGNPFPNTRNRPSTPSQAPRHSVAEHAGTRSDEDDAAADAAPHQHDIIGASGIAYNRGTVTQNIVINVYTSPERPSAAERPGARNTEVPTGLPVNEHTAVSASHRQAGSHNVSQLSRETARNEVRYRPVPPPPLNFTQLANMHERTSGSQAEAPLPSPVHAAAAPTPSVSSVRDIAPQGAGLQDENNDTFSTPLPAGMDPMSDRVPTRLRWYVVFEGKRLGIVQGYDEGLKMKGPNGKMKRMPSYWKAYGWWQEILTDGACKQL